MDKKFNAGEGGRLRANAKGTDAFAMMAGSSYDNVSRGFKKDMSTASQNRIDAHRTNKIKEKDFKERGLGKAGPGKNGNYHETATALGMLDKNGKEFSETNKAPILHMQQHENSQNMVTTTVDMKKIDNVQNGSSVDMDYIKAFKEYGFDLSKKEFRDAYNNFKNAGGNVEVGNHGIIGDINGARVDIVINDISKRGFEVKGSETYRGSQTVYKQEESVNQNTTTSSTKNNS